MAIHGLRYCNRLVEYQDHLVQKCNFFYLTQDQPFFVKVGFAIIMLAGPAILAYIFFKVTFNKIKYHSRYKKPYSSKDKTMMFCQVFLFLVLSVSTLYSLMIIVNSFLK